MKAWWAKTDPATEVRGDQLSTVSNIKVNTWFKKRSLS